jgi:uncharacterized protein (DUF362 family)
MDRRTFVKKSFGASIAFGALVKTGRMFSSSQGILPGGYFGEKPADLSYDLVAIKGGEPEDMFDQGIKALGGMQAFVKKGSRVVVKPNIGWDVSPERGGNTNPKLVSRIIKHCLDAGAKEVSVVDHPCDEWQRCYTDSGIEKAVKDAGGKMVPGASEKYYHPVAVKAGRTLTSTEEHEVILDADVFINVPILKSHSGTRLTAGMKNLMGNVWDRGTWHRLDVNQCIADFSTYRKPTLNVLDAYLVMTANGPRGISTNDVVVMKAQLISTDILALDVAGAKLFGVKPEDVRYIEIASQMKIGRKDLDNLNIKRISM